MSFIEVRNVEKKYVDASGDIYALRRVSFELEEGEFLMVMGPSGSGKSTLLSVIAGINRPTAGQVVIDGIDIYALPANRLANFRRLYSGFVFQEYHLIPYLSALENVMIPLLIDEKPAAARKKAAEALEMVGLGDKLRRLPQELSGGERARVGIARALVVDPEIILADEPTGNLDTETGAEVMEIFSRINRTGKTILMVTHNPELVRYGSSLLKIRDGRIESHGKLEKHELIAADGSDA